MDSKTSSIYGWKQIFSQIVTTISSNYYTISDSIIIDDPYAMHIRVVLNGGSIISNNGSTASV